MIPDKDLVLDFKPGDRAWHRFRGKWVTVIEYDTPVVLAGKLYLGFTPLFYRCDDCPDAHSDFLHNFSREAS